MSQWRIPPSWAKSTSETTSVITAEKKSPVITPARSSVWTGSHPPDAAMRYTMVAAISAPAKATADSPTVAAKRPLESPEMPEHRPQRRAARHAQHRGIRERVPRQRLERRPRDGKASARQRGEDDPRQPELQHDRGGEIRARPPHQRGSDVAETDRRRARWRARRGSREPAHRRRRRRLAPTRRREITARAPGGSRGPAPGAPRSSGGPAGGRGRRRRRTRDPRARR